jgi:peptide deformylase
MSDILTIDTAVAAGIKQPEQKVEPLDVFDDRNPLLSVAIPEFKGQLPNPNMTMLVKRLKFTMKLYSGLGLAANQCGIKERVFVIGTDQFQMACINPKVLEASEEIVKDTEGCLSFPAFFLSIPRPKWVDVEFTDENGQRKQTRLEGLTARCFLHELEHLNGVKFTSHVGSVAMLQAKRKQEKLIKKIVRRKK